MTHTLRRLERLLRSNVAWNRIYRAVSYFRSALWVIPFLAILIVLAIAPALRVIDGWLAWRVSGLGVAGATSLYQSVITLTLSFMVSRSARCWSRFKSPAAS
jgi:hypothetical protein